jgi:hypothetical protein
MVPTEMAAVNLQLHDQACSSRRRWMASDERWRFIENISIAKAAFHFMNFNVEAESENVLIGMERHKLIQRERITTIEGNNYNVSAAHFSRPWSISASVEKTILRRRNVGCPL